MRLGLIDAKTPDGTRRRGTTGGLRVLAGDGARGPLVLVLDGAHELLVLVQGSA
ncbi:UNVERIFIED_CONTAM: hypothetical protein RF648_03925 [Kocuria sp. CPCC 205274]